MPRAGHLINLEEPALFNTIMFGFLAAVDSGGWRRSKGASPNLGSSDGDTQ
jgi:hypothetical protein